MFIKISPIKLIYFSCVHRSKFYMNIRGLYKFTRNSKLTITIEYI